MQYKLFYCWTHVGLLRASRYLRERNPELKVLGRVSGNARTALLSGRGTEVAATIAAMARRYGLDGIEVALEWDGSKITGGAHGKQRLTAFVKVFFRHKTNQLNQSIFLLTSS